MGSDRRDGDRDGAVARVENRAACGSIATNGVPWSDVVDFGAEARSSPMVTTPQDITTRPMVCATFE